MTAISELVKKKKSILERYFKTHALPTKKRGGREKLGGITY